MKRVILLNLFILALLTNTMSQESVNNFHVEGTDLIWQKVFETPMNFEQLYDKVIESGLLENIVKSENKLTGELKQIDADFKGVGYSEMRIPMYIPRSYYTGFVIIELKESKYRVTIKRIVLTQKYDDSLTKQGEKTSIETYGLKRGKSEITSSFMKSPSLILDYTFKQKFEFKQTETNDKW
ncbi:MAG TPA: hypothetical protein PKG96_07345 [Bacilli bacterium]|jgi:hypothetical protein|nr:hypothetical protein [Bacilli bacterium]HQM04318.1 hypothetical protein [Tenuifilaceae bacterium]